MAAYLVEESVDANAEDILDFLAREVQYIHPDADQINQPARINNFYGERKDNTVSIYIKSSASDGQGKEVIRFEVISRLESISVIKAFYESNNSHIALRFYKIWSRVGVAFGANFAYEALRKMHDLK